MQLAWFIFLNKTTKAKQTQHVLKEIDSKELWLLRTEAKLKVFKTVLDSNLFQVMVFHLFSSIIKASPWLCVCNKCQVEYGSCELFSQYILGVEQLKKMNLRSAQTEEFLEESVVNEFLMADSICAVAADSKSYNTVWFERLHSIMRKQQLISLMIMAITLLQDKHTYMSHTMRSKGQPEIHRSTCEWTK